MSGAGAFRRQGGQSFGFHVDNAVRYNREKGDAEPVRTDISATLFLSEPDEYDASRAMHNLVEVLLALARDPSRLQATAVPLNLGNLIERVIADHRYLLAGKELTISYDDMQTTTICVPEMVTVSVVGNLIRNAIENGHGGLISVTLGPNAELVIRGPGSRMSARERSELHARLARAGEGRGDGIGLELVRRLCDHLGWLLDLDVEASGTTTARLKFRDPWCAAPRLDQ